MQPESFEHAQNIPVSHKNVPEYLESHRTQSEFLKCNSIAKEIHHKFFIPTLDRTPRNNYSDFSSFRYLPRARLCLGHLHTLRKMSSAYAGSSKNCFFWLRLVCMLIVNISHETDSVDRLLLCTFYRDFFDHEGGRNTCEFFKESNTGESLFIALKFDSRSIAKDILNRLQMLLLVCSLFKHFKSSDLVN